MVAFGVGQAEESLFEKRVLAIPQRQPEAQTALAIGHAEQSVLAPAVGARVVMVQKAFPAVVIRRVIFADGSPDCAR